METLIDLYDSDLLTIEGVVLKLEHMTMKPGNLQAFQDEVIERFGLAGFHVDVEWHVVESPGAVPVGTMMPTIRILGRVEPEEQFDREKMMHEVQHDILGIDPNPGAVQRDGSVKSLSKSTLITRD